jgi:hypothetical protein
MPLESPSWTTHNSNTSTNNNSNKQDVAMLWFTGSSTQGLPFVHDSFPANPKAVHHDTKPQWSAGSRMKGTSKRGLESRNEHGVEDITCDGTSAALQVLTHRDINSEVCHKEQV